MAVAYAEPPVSPPLGGGPAIVPTSPPVHTAAPVAAAPAPKPVEEPVATVQQAQVDETVAVFLNLKSGQRIWAGRFDTLELAEARAHEIVRGLIRPEPGVWAKFGNRFIRPSAVVSVELAPRRED